MIRLAVTGGIACGKSMTASLMEKQGVRMLDADDVAHRCLQRGNLLAETVIQEFGQRILDRDGNVDRGCLGAIVFADREKRVRLEAMLHPEIKKVCMAWLDDQKGAGMAGVVVPLLFETGMVKGWDEIFCVWAPPKLQVERLKGRGLNDVDVERRIAAQMPIAEKIARSDAVFVNYGTPAFLEKQVVRVLGRTREKSNAR